MVAHPGKPKSIHLNGIDLTYIEQGTGEGLVFVHGGVTDFRSWTSQMEPFAQRYHVISYSRRYHFPNPGVEKASAYLAIEHRDDLAALIEALRLAPAHIVASSYGAYIALLLASTHPELVRSLVLGEPPVPMLFGPEAILEMGKQVEPSRQAFKQGNPEQAIRVFIDQVAGPGGFERFPTPARQMMLDNAPEFKLEVNTLPDQYFVPFSCETANTIQAPTLFLTGEHSPQFLYRMTDALEKCIPNAERAMIPHASHGMHNQNPEGYNQTVLAFLARHS